MGHILITCTPNSTQNVIWYICEKIHRIWNIMCCVTSRLSCIKVSLLSVNAERGAARFGNGGSSYDAHDSLDCIHTQST